ncbi:hypothetical protein GQ55_1G276100 [Panicum hallii var. hallii]|uniref:Uncharacterized protein n=1 Tax=Panicum hallii var. hallii TaxID=1504633 RepID=A0A2T7F878_9POAL|nr:hypothetical protein GQ55_1G276100 [Panicum hallii var. hallii]
MEAVAYGNHSRTMNNLLVEGESYDFFRVGFAPTLNDPLAHFFLLCSHYFILLSPHTVICEPLRTVWIAIFPRTFRHFENVFRQRENMFVDIIGLVVYVDDIRDRNNFRRRPNRHVVLINERPAASDFRTMAALHVRKNAMARTPITGVHSDLIST